MSFIREIRHFIFDIWHALAKRQLRPDEKTTIADFAAGASNLRKQAIEIYRVYRSHSVIDGNPYLCFMSQVDRGEQDDYLREYYRNQVLSLSA